MVFWGLWPPKRLVQGEVMTQIFCGKVITIGESKRELESIKNDPIDIELSR